MKNKIKFYLVIGLITVFSLNTQAQVKFGVKAGLNFKNVGVDYKDSEDEIDTDMNIGYHIGGTVEYTFNEKMSLQSGLIWSSKGFKTEEKIDMSSYGIVGTIENKINMIINYIEVPIHLAYKLNDFQIYAGPYFAFGVSGKVKTEWNSNIEGSVESGDSEIKFVTIYGEVKSDDEFDRDESPINAFDYGLNIGIGYQLGSVLLNVGYSHGLGNMIPKYEDSNSSDYKMYHRVFSLSATYIIN